jgi:hypothetical protein
MKVLLAGEESQVTTEQFILLGHDAMRCDIAYDGAKGLPHYRGDVRDLLTEFFDLVIFHPVCKYITNSGVRWLHTDWTRWGNLKRAVDFFNLRHQFNSPCVATENPIPHKYAVTGKDSYGTWFCDGIGMYDQLIQPWQFGHGETKATCFWLKGLPKLQPTNIVQGREQRIWKMPPGPDRGRMRSKTYEGIAAAMADQWSKHLTKLKVA